MYEVWVLTRGKMRPVKPLGKPPARFVGKAVAEAMMAIMCPDEVRADVVEGTPGKRARVEFVAPVTDQVTGPVRRVFFNR